jgi:hypothetical protein
MDVVADGDRSGLDGPGQRRPRRLEARPCQKVRDLLGEACPCDRRYELLTVIERRDPYQLELAVLDGDAAGFAQQRLAVMHADDRRVDLARDRAYARELHDLLLPGHVLEAEGDVAGELGQELQFLLVEEIPHAGR